MNQQLMGPNKSAGDGLKTSSEPISMGRAKSTLGCLDAPDLRVIDISRFRYLFTLSFRFSTVFDILVQSFKHVFKVSLDGLESLRGGSRHKHCHVILLLRREDVSP